MAEKCRYCESSVPPGNIICPSCGSYLVDVETKKKRLHLFLIPLAMTALATGVILYLNMTAEHAAQAELEVPEARPDPVKPQSEIEAKMDQKRSQRSKNIKKILAEQKLARQEAEEKWKKMSPEEKHAFLGNLHKQAVEKVKQGKGQVAAGKLSDEAGETLADIESRLKVGQTYIDRKQYSVARGWLQGIHSELIDLLPSEESLQP